MLLIPLIVATLLVPRSADRWVFLGDSITDGNTYPLLIEQSLREARKDVPIFFNAGIGGDTSTGMLARLDRDVFTLRPTIVSISAGINDQMPATEFERNIRAIVAAIKKHKAEPILLTTTTVDRPVAEVQAKLDSYNAIIHLVAKEEKLRLAEVQDQFRGKAGLFVEDGIHPNFEGHRLIAGATLDAVGYRNLNVPAKLNPPAMPGIVRTWRVRLIAENETVTEANLARHLSRDSGKPLSLPQKSGDTAIWPNQERVRGFAMELDKEFGQSERFLSSSEIEMDRDQESTLLVGGDVRSVYVNGKLAYQKTVYRGWHAHPVANAVLLRKGKNPIVVESGSSFFLSYIPKM